MRTSCPKFIALAVVAAAILAIPVASGAETPTNSTGASATQPGPERFYGPISKVDAAKHTFTVNEQTFTVTAETQMTTGDGQKASFTNAAVGEPARGTYTKSKDGALNVTKVRFGKKAGGKSGGGKGKNGGKKKESSASDSPNQ
jgi:hypothetical protein